MLLHHQHSIAAAFGNVHGVYKPGNVVLSPERLVTHQAFAKKQLSSSDDKPLFLVMHGGSGSTQQEIKTAVSAGVVKMNIDTDTQFAYWTGVRDFEAKNRAYLQGQIGNPTGDDKVSERPAKSEATRSEATSLIIVTERPARSEGTSFDYTR